MNWKSVRDVDNEGYHVAMSHPALQDLYGSTYFDLPYVNGVSRSLGSFNPHAGRRWSVRNYVRIAGDQEWLPENKRRVWGYYGLFPNLVIAVTPESVQFYQEFPLAVDRTLIRGAVYRRPDETGASASRAILPGGSTAKPTGRHSALDLVQRVDALLRL